MNDLISRQAATDAICSCTEVYVNNLPVLLDKREVLDVIEKLVEADPERKKGRWILLYEEFKKETYTDFIPHSYCSECGAEYDPHTTRLINFCPNCGADMRGEQDG